MIQPYLPEIARDGEWSFLFFAGYFSHAVIKRPASGDFRVQCEYGGTHEAAVPPMHLTLQAHAALRAAPAHTLYARVDGVVLDGDLVVTELELIEPSLFLDADPGAPGRLARRIVDRRVAASAA